MRIYKYVMYIVALIAVWGLFYTIEGVMREMAGDFLTGLFMQVSIFFSTMKDRMSLKKVEEYDAFGWGKVYYVNLNMLNVGGDADDK